MEHFVKWDLSVLDWIAKHVQSDLLDQLMPMVSWLGNSGMVWILLALVLLCIPKERAGGLQILLALGFSAVFCNLLLKNLVGRVRPFELVAGIELLVKAPRDFSFPSGHTSAAFAAAMVMVLNRSNLKYYLAGLAVLMGFSRLYLYVHYTTDIIGGIITGLAAGYLAVKCYRLLAERHEKRQGRLSS